MAHYMQYLTEQRQVAIYSWVCVIGLGFELFAITFPFFSISGRLITLFFSSIRAIRLGIVITVVFAFEGGLMGAMLRHTVGATDGGAGLPLLNWSKQHGDLRVAHFLGIHALQILPLLAVMFAKSVQQVIIASALYFVFVSFTFIQALRGKPIISL